MPCPEDNGDPMNPASAAYHHLERIFMIGDKVRLSVGSCLMVVVKVDDQNGECLCQWWGGSRMEQQAIPAVCLVPGVS